MLNGAPGIITTFTGIPGTFDNTGDGGPATSAKLDGPEGLMIDSSNNMYISTYHFFRKIDGQTGIISTLGSWWAQPGTATEDNFGNLYIPVANWQVVFEIVAATGQTINYAGGNGWGYSGDGGPATGAAMTNTLGTASYSR
jgi:hypothetical protein